MTRHEKILEALGILTNEAKELVQTFNARIGTMYDHKKIVREVCSGLLLYKKNPSEGTAQFVSGKLNEIKSKVFPAFQKINPDIPAAGEMKKELLTELHDFETLQKDIEDKKLGAEARKKMIDILKGMRAEIEQQQENVSEAEHIADLVRLANGFAAREKTLLSQEIQLIQKTEQAVKQQKSSAEYDSLEFEWKTLLSDMDSLLRQEKIDVIDHITPLLKKQYTITDRINRILGPFAWTRQKRRLTQEEIKTVMEGKRITAEDIARDLQTFTMPGETQQYISLLSRHPEVLDERAREFIAKGSYMAGTTATIEHKRLTNLAFKDPLTGLDRRIAFDEQIKIDLGLAHRSNEPLAILFIDGDNFKQYNDRYSHAIGDQVLIFIAKIIKSELLREGDTAYRWGGEEMVVLLPKTDLNGAVEVATRILYKMRAEGKEFMSKINAKYAPILASQGKQPMTEITVSIGIATHPEDAITAEDLVHVADARVYEAKAQGRNRIVTRTQVIK
jgi:diguanylate cyclase (GGDEF)-like protein